jgi:hypothetical protein
MSNARYIEPILGKIEPGCQEGDSYNGLLYATERLILLTNALISTSLLPVSSLPIYIAFHS